MHNHEARAMAPSTHHIIPEGESYCVWMDAGLVNYKLCNCNFECEQCAFDAVMRTQAQAAPAAPAAHNAAASGAAAQTVDQLLAHTMQRLVESIASTPLPEDRLYSADHTWVKVERDDLFTLGIDHCIGQLLSSAHAVAFPTPPTPIDVHEPFAWILINGETIAVRTPVAGTIIDVNATLAESSSLLHADPYNAGWIARLRPRRRGDTSSLMPAKEFSASLEKGGRAFQRGVDAELRAIQSQLHGTMSDGGTVLEDFETILGSRRYYGIVEELIRGRT